MHPLNPDRSAAEQSQSPPLLPPGTGQSGGPSTRIIAPTPPLTPVIPPPPPKPTCSVGSSASTFACRYAASSCRRLLAVHGCSAMICGATGWCTRHQVCIGGVRAGERKCRRNAKQPGGTYGWTTPPTAHSSWSVHKGTVIYIAFLAGTAAHATKPVLVRLCACACARARAHAHTRRGPHAEAGRAVAHLLPLQVVFHEAPLLVEVEFWLVVPGGDDAQGRKGMVGGPLAGHWWLGGASPLTARTWQRGAACFLPCCVYLCFVHTRMHHALRCAHLGGSRSS